MSNAPDLADLLAPLENFVSEPSVVGSEDAFVRVVRRELDVRISYCSGMLVAQGRRPGDLFLSAHVDRHGLLCTGSNYFQYAAYVFLLKSKRDYTFGVSHENKPCRVSGEGRHGERGD